MPGKKADDDEHHDPKVTLDPDGPMLAEDTFDLDDPTHAQLAARIRASLRENQKDDEPKD